MNYPRVVGSNRIVARIQVPAAAPVDLYDIEVTLTNGKKGVGAEMFEVQLAKPNDDFPVTITVEDAGLSGPYRIRSDGAGEYINGVSNVAAYIDNGGNLHFSAETSSGGRALTYDFSNQVSGAPYSPNTTGMLRFTILTQGNLTSPVPRIIDMPIGSSHCRGLSASYRNATLHHRSLFHSYQENYEGTPSIFAHVTRTTATTWTIRSDGPCAGNPTWAGVWSQVVSNKPQPYVFRGYYAMPFSMVLRLL